MKMASDSMKGSKRLRYSRCHVQIVNEEKASIVIPLPSIPNFFTEKLLRIAQYTV